MRDYIPAVWKQDRTARLRAKALIEDYDRRKRERQDILLASARPLDGLPRGNRIGDPTQAKALYLASVDADLAVVEQAASVLCGLYHPKVALGFDPLKAYHSYDYFNYQHHRKHDEDEGPSYRTWLRYRDAFLWQVAIKANYVKVS